MKSIKQSLFLFIILTIANYATAQRDYCRIVNDNWNILKVEFNTPSPNKSSVAFNGVEFSSISVEGFIPSSVEGAPCLPVFSHLIEVPECGGFEVAVSDAEYDTILVTGPQIMPVQPSRSKSDTVHHPLVINKKIYTTDDFYGYETATVEAVGIARDRHLARLQFSPFSYNPVSGQLVVCRHATVTVRYRNADREASLSLFNRYHSPQFASNALVMNSLYPKSVTTAVPIRYLIVAHSSFRRQLDTFVEWKRRKGYITDIVYTDSSAVGTTTTSIAAFTQAQYTNATAANPAPTYLLIVGDHEQVPAFTGTTDNDHITDLYYISWTSGDNIPDCYCGRFSAQNVAELTPQIEKTLMYEQYTFADPTFLDRAVLVAGVDGGSAGDFGYTHADPAMDYAATHYVNSSRGFTQVMYFKNNTTIVPSASGITIGNNSSSNSSTVRSYYNQGAGFINYSAHGSATSWGTPNFTTSHVASMTNSQKFGLMIGNCCLTNKFETTNCFGESLLRKDNYCGAVGYIGGSNSTYWNEDFYWAVGLRSSISATMSLAYNANNLGAYDRMCHTHGESYSQWAITQGAVMMVGNMAVESSTSSRKLYYWEIYHLMGDPSVMTYMTQASAMTVSAPSFVTAGSSSMTVTAAPYAYIALTDNNYHTVVTATYADANGNATLLLPTSLPLGTYELAASAQQYQTTFSQVTVIHPSGKYPTVLKITPNNNLIAGTELDVDVYVCNLGDSTAYNVTTTITSDANSLFFNPSAITIDSLHAGDTAVVSCHLQVSNSIADGTGIAVTTASTCSGLSQDVIGIHHFSVIAPVVDIDISHSILGVAPGGETTVTAIVSNLGHAALDTTSLTLTSATRLLSVGTGISQATDGFALAPGESATFTFPLHADSQLPMGINIPMTLALTSNQGSSQQFNIYVGANPYETFEGNMFHTTGWTQGTYPWTITDNSAHNGTYSLRSSETLTHSQTSQIDIALNVTTADTLTFYYKVSSETNYDKFHFLIDGTDKITESGELDWTRATYLLSAGSHTLSFTYAKDGSVDRNSDCVWIDDIVLPHHAREVVFSSADLCVGDDYSVGNIDVNTSEPVDSGIVYLGTHAYSTIQVVDYSVHPTYDIELDTVACDNFTWNGQSYTTSTEISRLFESSYGCDSTVTIRLTVNQSVAATIYDTAYTPNYQWNDSVYTEGGSYIQTFASANGCDSTVTLLLTVLDTNALDIVNSQLSTHDSQLHIYPNPTRGMVFFDKPVRDIAIYDASGRKMSVPGLDAVSYNSRKQSLDISALPNGTYMMFLTTADGGTTLRRVVLKH